MSKSIVPSKHLPSNTRKLTIHIICEGSEEFNYIEELKKLGKWNANIVVETADAKSMSNIIDRLQTYNRVNPDKLCFVFCDAGFDENSDSRSTLEDILYEVDKLYNNMSYELVYYGNPLTMQIVILHFGKVNIPSEKKSENARIIERETKVKSYDGLRRSRKELMSKINSENYDIMKANLIGISPDYHDRNSTNIKELFDALENHENIDWFLALIEKIKE